MRKPPYLQSPTAFSKAFTATSKMMFISVSPFLSGFGAGGLVSSKRLELAPSCACLAPCRLLDKIVAAACSFRPPLIYLESPQCIPRW